MDKGKIAELLKVIDAEAYITGFAVNTGEGYDVNFEMNGDGRAIMCLLAALVKLVSNEFEYTTDKVMADIQELLQKIPDDEAK